MMESHTMKLLQFIFDHHFFQEGKMSTVISAEKVKVRAYELYLERGGFNGSDQDDWYKAEAELLQGNKSGTKKKSKSTVKTK